MNIAGQVFIFYITRSALPGYAHETRHSTEAFYVVMNTMIIKDIIMTMDLDNCGTEIYWAKELCSCNATSMMSSTSRTIPPFRYISLVSNILPFFCPLVYDTE